MAEEMIFAAGAMQMLMEEAAAYPGALAYMDFIAGIYAVGDTELTASDVVDSPGLIGAAGLAVPAADTPPEIIGAMLAALGDAIEDMTLLVEWTDFDGNDHYPFYLTSDPPSWSYTCSLFLDKSAPLLIPFFNDNSTSARSIFSFSAIAVGTHRAALTRKTERLAGSIDGATVETKEQAAAGPFTLTRGAFGGLPGDTTAAALYVRKFILYSSMADAQLPALSVI